MNRIGLVEGDASYSVLAGSCSQSVLVVVSPLEPESTGYSFTTVCYGKRPARMYLLQRAHEPCLATNRTVSMHDRKLSRTDRNPCPRLTLPSPPPSRLACPPRRRQQHHQQRQHRQQLGQHHRHHHLGLRQVWSSRLR